MIIDMETGRNNHVQEITRRQVCLTIQQKETPEIRVGTLLWMAMKFKLTTLNFKNHPHIDIPKCTFLVLISLLNYRLVCPIAYSISPPGSLMSISIQHFNTKLLNFPLIPTHHILTLTLHCYLFYNFPNERQLHFPSCLGQSP